MEDQGRYNPYTGTYMHIPEGNKVRKELINRTTNTLREAKKTDPELVINVALILLLQFLLFKFLAG